MIKKLKHKWVASLSVFAVVGCLGLPDAQAATVAGGAMVLNLDRDAVIAGVNKNTYPDTATAEFPICCRPSLYLEEYFDATAASKTFTQVRDENTPDLYDNISDEISATGLSFAVNNSTIAPNASGRYNKANTFSFDPGNLTGSAAGNIGLGGVLRFRVDVAPPSNRVLLGDMDLEYRPSLENSITGRSGWVLVNNIGFTIDSFHLFDVVTDLTGSHLSLTGNLGLGEGFAHLGGINDHRVGTFSFQTAVVPLPGAVWLFATGVFGLVAAGYRKQPV